MEDLSVVLKQSLLRNLYKKRSDAFGTVEQRVLKMNEKRKSLRHDVALERRKIPENLTPVVTPVDIKRKKTPVNNNKPVNKRLEMLQAWKAEKQKRREEEKKVKKPLFKVTHVSVELGLPNLDNVNKEIKGKPIRSKFAPPNHKFKAPANIKPIALNNNQQERQIVTRSQARAQANLNAKDNGAKKKEIAKSKKTTKQQDKVVNNTTQKDLNESMSPDYPITIDKETKTPEKTKSPVYLSPFVTVSRGKDKARKEYEARRLGQSFSFDKDVLESSSPKAGAKYFQWRLDKEIDRLKQLCDQWTKYKAEENLPEEAISLIDVAIGQTNLLLTKKFGQFHSLIDACLHGDVNTPVTCEDLHGFWDMMYIQVKNLDKRFEDLEKLRSNNWQEIIPEVKKVAKKRGRPLKSAKASAGLKEAILAARRKKKESGENAEIIEKKTPQNRNSINIHRLKSGEKTHRNSSPGLMMMKVSQYAKGVDTPARSILKSDSQKSVKSQTKTVLFEDEMLDHINDIENDLNNLNLQSKGKTPTRRSIRLTKSKLF